MRRSAVASIALALLLAASLCGAAQISVLDMGAVPDGVTDNTDAFQRALNEAGKTASVVDVPAGKYRINGNLNVPRGVTLQGSYRTVALPMDNLPTSLIGTVLMAYAGRGSEKGPSFITLNDASTLAGVIITYPEWSQKVVPPVPYPPCISGRGANCAIRDCQILNAYEAIHFWQTHRFLISNVQGYPIKRGIFVDECYDIGRIENVHFWPFGVNYDPKDPYCEWVNLNGVAFEFARTDWQAVTNTFCFGYGVGYKFSEYKAGGCNGSFVGIGADSCQNAVVVEQAQAPGLLIANGQFVGRWSSTNAVTMVVGPKVTGKVSLSNCAFWGPIDKCVSVNSPQGQFTAIGCNFVNYDNKGVGAPCVELNQGSAVIQGSTFSEGRLQVKIGPKVKSAIVLGNQCADGLVVDNAIGAKAQISANTPDAANLSSPARAAYRLDVGAAGDSRFVVGWSGREPASEWADKKGTKRWSSDGARFTLPVIPGKAYKVSADISVPAYALQPGAGLYMGNKRIISITKAGTAVVTGELPAVKIDMVTLELRVKNWAPKDHIAGSSDARSLGVAVRSITLRAVGSKGPLYIANTGEQAK